MGNVVDAERYHAAVKMSVDGDDKHPVVAIQQGLLLFSTKKYQAALNIFNAVVKMDIDFNVTHMLLSIGVAIDDLVVAAANNIAVAALHCCEVRLGINCIEALLQQDPARFMTDAILFNLCTLYDLAYNTVFSTRRKKMLQTVAKLYYLNTIAPTSFRL